MNIIKEMYEKYKEIILYGVFGVLTTLVSIVTFYLFVDKLEINYIVGNVLSWVFAVAFAYITNKIWVFENNNFTKNYILKEVMSFVGSRIATLVIETVLIFLLVDLISIEKMISKIFVSIIVVILNYVFSKLFVFNKK